MTEQRADFDGPWKEILEDYFQDFLLFFFPEINTDINWDQGYEFLDKELQQVVRDAAIGTRYGDKLVKVWRAGGEELWVLIHVEVQAQPDSKFEERMFTYNYRLRDRYGKPVASLAVLADERPNWRPNEFKSELWGCSIVFRFPTIKLLDYGKQWQSLENSSNPFATVVMAHLKSQETRDDPDLREQWKFSLTRRLYERGYERQDVLNLFRFIDWVIALPQEFETRFRHDLEEYEREAQMPYVTSVERIAKQEGVREGLLEGLLEGIKLGLELKFGDEGLELLPEISQIQDTEVLKELQAGIKQASSTEKLRSIYQDDSQAFSP